MPPEKQISQLWDLPLRLFHWLLVALVIAAYVTALLEMTGLHMALGQITLALLLFRILWGFFGSETARFSGFVRGWRAVLAYASGLFSRRATPHRGHNPMGGWAVLAMLLALFAQTGSGLFSNDDIFSEGPLAHLVSKEASHTATGVHEFNFYFILLPLLGLHIAAVLFYLLWKKHNLITPMITGRDKALSGTVGQMSRGRIMARAALCLAVAAGTVIALTKL
ncbi:MAG: hypothetical protein GC131_04845 [Alphaproteobacteria bacterium]|nr:hypothetical protein [Alphaproteobacteria bacterium]